MHAVLYAILSQAFLLVNNRYLYIIVREAEVYKLETIPNIKYKRTEFLDGSSQLLIMNIERYCRIFHTQLININLVIMTFFVLIINVLKEIFVLAYSLLYLRTNGGNKNMQTMRMELKGLLKEINEQCKKCLECDPCCTANLIRKCIESERFIGYSLTAGQKAVRGVKEMQY